MNAAWLPLVVALPLLASALTAAAPWRVVLSSCCSAPLATAVVGVWLIGIHRETPVLATNVGGFPVGIAIPSSPTPERGPAGGHRDRHLRRAALRAAHR